MVLKNKKIRNQRIDFKQRLKSMGVGEWGIGPLLKAINSKAKR